VTHVEEIATPRGAEHAASSPLLALEQVSCRHPGAKRPALDAVDFAVRAGEIVAVMGHSGAGKTTLLKCLTGIVPRFDRADVSGTRRAFGEDLAALEPGSLAGRVGIVFQDFEAQLFSTSCILEVGFAPQQLGLPRDVVLARGRRALERVGLAGFERRDPATLSGGEKQRLALAGILALEPRVLLLDEPITDIDPEGKRTVLALLAALRDEGVGVVIVEHEILAAETADRLVLLEAGRVVAEGPSAELLADATTLRACGIRPRDLDVVRERLALPARLADVDDAERTLRARGLTPRHEAGARAAKASPSRDLATPLLELRDVRFSYGDGVAALDGVSLRIDAGELVAVIGQNGSGKTTLAKHLNGLLAPDAGCVRLTGTDLRELRLGAIARSVGYVFQDPDHQLFCATVEEEVAWGVRHLGIDARAVEERVARALDVCALGDRRGDDPFLLRKGERQRLAVASILALEPKVLILDEPTTGLDHREQLAILDLLGRLHATGTAVVVITHAPWLVAERATRAVLLAHGRILLDGDVHELFRAGSELSRASFVLPDATRLGLRFDVAVRSPGELVDRIGGGPGA
jgi:energy-coupling factor transport system ATP-binding protein